MCVCVGREEENVGEKKRESESVLIFLGRFSQFYSHLTSNLEVLEDLEALGSFNLVSFVIIFDSCKLGFECDFRVHMPCFSVILFVSYLEL